MNRRQKFNLDTHCKASTVGESHNSNLHENRTCTCIHTPHENHTLLDSIPTGIQQQAVNAG